MCPAIIMLGYFIYRHMAPFGSQTILTVDLGEQYIDFFRYFKHILLHPSGFFYSFGKAIGGGMFGDVAYYLLSPFNLILLLFPGNSIVSGILWLTVLKYGLAGLAFGYLLKKRNLQTGVMVPAFATSYALMAWFVANQLNLLWLDAAIFLPLIALTLMNMLEGKNRYAYSLMLALMMVINYYMGYMICIFLVLFFCWFEASRHISRQQFFKDGWLFIKRSLLAAAIGAIVLLPTAYSLLNSKGAYTQAMTTKFQFFLPKIMSKMVLGAYSFNQMSWGLPNIFVGSLALFGTIVYFLASRFSWRQRIVALAISAFLVVSMTFDPLVLFWHAFQFPVWYPCRFSFVISFWMVFLAAVTFKNEHLTITWWQAGIVALLFGGMITYNFINIKKFGYVNTTELYLSLAFGIIILLLLFIQPADRFVHLRNVLLFCAVLGEMGTNVVLSLGSITYLSKSDYDVPATQLAIDSRQLHHLDNGFYRVSELYNRDRNDGIAFNMNTGSYFSSALEKAIPDFYGKIGDLDGDNNVSYSNGTVLSDSLLNMKYAIAPTTNQTTPPLNQLTEINNLSLYDRVDSTAHTAIFKNPYAAGIAYAAGDKIKHMPAMYDNPIAYQNEWLNAVLGNKKQRNYFKVVNFNGVQYTNSTGGDTLTNQVFSKKDQGNDGKIDLTFVPDSNDIYYLTLGAALASQNNNANISLNGQPLYQDGSFRHTVIANVASDNKHQQVSVSIDYTQPSVQLQNFVLYRMNNHAVTQGLKDVQRHSLHVTRFSSRKIIGTINVPHDKHIVTTTIPYSKGWHVRVDGHRVKPFKVQQALMAFNVKPGKHTIKMTYTPPFFYVGLLVSFLAIAWVVYQLRDSLKELKRMRK